MIKTTVRIAMILTLGMDAGIAPILPNKLVVTRRPKLVSYSA
jgi:hypothetical protein